MASTRRKRQTKHRGNAAGIVVARGRTGRKPTLEEKGKTDKKTLDKQRRQEKLDRPPTWQGAFVRALTAAVAVIGLGVLFLHMAVGQAAILLPVVLIVYVPAGYYMDLWLHNRRQRRKRERAASPRT
jgi:Flp pilus assembly protein TadB